jgi:hypothetical protein
MSINEAADVSTTAGYRSSPSRPPASPLPCIAEQLRAATFGRMALVANVVERNSVQSRDLAMGRTVDFTT